MKTRGRNYLKDNRRRPGKPPRWLVLSALASTALSGRAYAQESDKNILFRDSAAQVLPAKNVTLEAAAAPNPDRHRLTIPPGPLGEVLDAFQVATGLTVELQQEDLRDIASPGVSGQFSAQRALEELLAGTGVTYRFLDAGTVTLELMLAETIDVTERYMPSSPKYTEPLRDVPQTLMVIPQALIQEQGASTLRDALRNVTGISIQAGEGGGGLPGDNLSIRGFASRNDIFVDGVRDFGAYSRDPFNVEQIEVAKGPASLYAGRGSTGGSLNLASKSPRLDALGNATLGAGTESFGRATVDFNQPLESRFEGTSVRLNAMFTRGEVAGRDVVEGERWGVAPSLAFGLGTPTRVTLSYSQFEEDNTPEYGLPWVPPTNIPLAEYADKPAPVDYNNFYGLVDRDYEEVSTGIATAEVEHDFEGGITLRSLLRHGRTDRDSVITSPRFASNDSTAINRQLQSRDLVDTILAQQNDLTARFATGAVEHALVAGIEAVRETSENHARIGPTAPLADLFDPNPDDPYRGPIVRTGARTESKADTLAVYATDTVKLNDRWELTGGLRWDHFHMDFDSVAVDGVLTPFERTDRMLSWRAGVVHKPRENGSVYLSAGTSFNPAADGATGLSLSASTVALEPEKSRGYEAGTKWDFFGARLSLNAALFRTEKTNARTPGVNPGDPPIVLQGEQRVDGAELGVSGRLSNAWYAYLGYTWLTSEVLESNTPSEVGNELPNTPENSLSLWTTYRLRRGFEVGAGAQFVDDRFNNVANVRVAPSYTLYDAMASYQVNQTFTLRLNAYNLTNERYIDRVGGGHFIPGAGRSLALTTSIDF